MRRSFRLTQGQPALSINVDFQAAAIVIDNPTGSPVFLRTGAPDIPDQQNADIVAPAASSSSHATSGRDFGAALGDPSLIESSSSALSGLFDVVVLTLLDASEQLPSYGSFSFLSLSLTDLLPLRAFVAGYIGPFDLGPWGGLHVLVLPSVGTGQGIAQVEVKQTAPDVATGWTIYGSWAFWPGLPLSLTLPRTARYVRIFLNSALIPGDPAIGGSVACRASMAEIAQLAATPSTNALLKGVNVAGLGTVSSIYATVGQRAVTARLNVLVGTAARLIVYSASSPGGPWALVTTREQLVTGVDNSIARAIGQLDAFLRLDVADVGGGGLQTTLALSIQEAPDLTGHLGNIHSALGDVGQPTSTGQSIYSRLSQLHADVDGLEAAVTATNTKLDTLHTDVDGLEAAVAATNTAIAATNTKLDTLIAQPNVASASQSTIASATVSGAWLNTGVTLVVGYYLTSVQLSWQIKAALADDYSIELAFGTAGAPVVGFYRVGGVLPEATLPPYVFAHGVKGGGVVVGTNNVVWINVSAAPAFVNLSLTTRAA